MHALMDFANSSDPGFSRIFPFGKDWLILICYIVHREIIREGLHGQDESWKHTWRPSIAQSSRLIQFSGSWDGRIDWESFLGNEMHCSKIQNVFFIVQEKLTLYAGADVKYSLSSTLLFFRLKRNAHLSGWPAPEHGYGMLVVSASFVLLYLLGRFRILKFLHSFWRMVRIIDVQGRTHSRKL